jgi:hypothetical protein
MTDPNAAKRFYESIKREWAAYARGLRRELKWERGAIDHLHDLAQRSATAFADAELARILTEHRGRRTRKARW